MKVNDEELENLMKANIEPPTQWQVTALENIKKSVTDSNTIGINNSNLNFISHIMLKRKFVVMGIVFLTLLTVLVATGVTVLNLRNNQGISDQKEILSKIAQNNPNFGRSLNTLSSAAGLAADTASESYIGDMKMIAPGYPINSDYSYYYSKSTTSRGPAFGSCSYGMDTSAIVYVPIYESYTYNDGTTYYSKHVGYNQDNSINTLSISKSTSNETSYEYEDITYYGGSYAVKTFSKTDYGSSQVRPLTDQVEPMVLEDTPEVKQEAADSNATTYTPAIVDVPSYFGEEANIIRTQNIDGKDYYVVQYSYEADCSGGMNQNLWQSDSAPQKSTLYTLTYANVDTYQILRTETYINSVDAGNLMESFENINDNANIDFASVESNFVFTLDVPVREVDVSSVSGPVTTYDPDAEVQKAVDFGVAKNLTLVLPEGQVSNQYVYFNYGMDDIYVQTTTAYYSDREFYPAGELGDKMFNSYNGISSSSMLRSYPLSLGAVSYSIGDASYNLNVYENSEDEMTILNSFLYGELRNKNESTVAVSINGELIDARLYSYETEQYGGISAMPFGSTVDSTLVAPDSCTEDCFTKQYVLIFDYGTNKYALQEYNYAVSTAVEFTQEADGIFKSLSVSNELNQIRDLINNSIKGTYVNSSEVAPAGPAL